MIELGILMALLLCWQFVLGEFVGGPLMIVFLAILFRIFLKRQLVDEAHRGGEGAARIDGGSRRDGHVG